MKHKHYDMGVAKLDNTTLVKFVKLLSGWVVTQSEDWNVASDYFLCLPKHKKAVLNSLNGGAALAESAGETLEHAMQNAEWSDDDWYMSDDFTSRIKPKKEKRWIIWNENQDKYHCTFLVDPLEKYEANFKFSIHEIEVEV